MRALVSRNNVAHSYNQAIALDIVRETKERYVGLFQDLKGVGRAVGINFRQGSCGNTPQPVDMPSRASKRLFTAF